MEEKRLCKAPTYMISSADKRRRPRLKLEVRSTDALRQDTRRTDAPVVVESHRLRTETPSTWIPLIACHARRLRQLCASCRGLRLFFRTHRACESYFRHVDTMG